MESEMESAVVLGAQLALATASGNRSEMESVESAIVLVTQLASAAA